MITTTIKDQRSTIAPQNIQAVVDAGVSLKGSTLSGQQQYSTPPEWAELFASQLPGRNPATRFDPQCAAGNLLSSGFPQWHQGFVAGIEIDQRITQHNHPAELATGNCVTAWALLEEHFPDTNFVCQLANPPFGIQWKLPTGETVDSTEHTWRMIQRFAAPDGYGYFVASLKTIERLGIDKHPWSYLYQKLPVGLWKQCDVSVGVIHWHKTDEPRDEALVIEFEELDLDRYRDASKDIAPDVSYFNAEATMEVDLQNTWKVVQDVLAEESKSTPYNIWLERGLLRIHLSTRFKLDRKPKREEILALSRMDNCHPLTLTTEAETRRILQVFIAQEIYTISPKAEEAIQSALEQANGVITPIMPPTDFELVGYADECESIICTQAKAFPEGTLTSGRRYSIRTGTYTFKKKFTRRKQHFKDGESYTLDHTCELSGQDRYIEIIDDVGQAHRFMDRPNKKAQKRWQEHEDSVLWSVFQCPDTATVKELHVESYSRIRKQLDELTCLIREGKGTEQFTFYPGQLDYLCRVGTTNRSLVAADVGCGKTLMALALLQLQLGLGRDFNGRALIVAPQGTIKDQRKRGQETVASQWKQEIQRFAPGTPVFTITDREDFLKIIEQHGKLPTGIYISYYESMFKNGAIESITRTQSHRTLCNKLGLEPGPSENVYHLRNVWTNNTAKGNIEHLGILGFQDLTLQSAKVGERLGAYSVVDITQEPVINCTEGVGLEKHGITCVVTPCLASEIFAYDRNAFDATVLDEAQVMTNLSAHITQRICRIQTRYRYALSATPIPNIVSNLFSIMGWLCVDDWFRGDKRSPRWPYAVSEIARFNETFLSTERDHTTEEMRKGANGGKPNKCLKTSPVISAPARLLKLIKPTLAFISKSMCNPDYREAEITDIRVPMGTKQSELYNHFLNPEHTPCENQWMRAGRIIGRLREIAAAPSAVTFGGPPVLSDFNPKTITCLELLAPMLERGEQCVIISSRIEQSNTVYKLLAEAIGKDQISRIDSTVGPKNTAGESARFKSGQSRVMIMGIKCAAGHSFSHCPNEIVISIEFNYGTLHQAKGRIDRVNSAQQAKIFVILHKDSIEESMFDNCATKQDAATICLHGNRIPRDFVPVEMGTVLANHLDNAESASLNGQTTDETTLESDWPTLLERIKNAQQASRRRRSVGVRARSTQSKLQVLFGVKSLIGFPRGNGSNISRPLICFRLSSQLAKGLR